MRAVAAAEQLAGEGVQCRVNRPAHHHAARCRRAAAARDTGAVVTSEEHNVIGGLGGAGTEALAETCPVPVVRTGVADRFTESGPCFDLPLPPRLLTADVLACARRALKVMARAQ